jgi:AcrR family transcriptional regulator
MTRTAKRARPVIAEADASATSGGGSENRRGALLNAAAKLFAERGYDGTSTRDIAAIVGMLPGSIYYHFPSKEKLLLAVHEEGVRQTQTAVERALAETNPGDAWGRLERACEAHLSSLLAGTPYSRVITPDFIRALPAPIRRTAISQRDAYERLFIGLVEALDLLPGTDAHYFRLALLGSLNWAIAWYRPGGDSPAHIAREILALFRGNLAAKSSGRAAAAASGRRRARQSRPARSGIGAALPKTK